MRTGTRLGDDQLDDVVAALRKGPRANGFSTELWTLARVAQVIESTTGVRYGQTQTWETLRKRLGWTRQRPGRRALEHDDEAIANWVEVEWPRIIKVPGAAGRGSSSKTSTGVCASPVREGDLGSPGARLLSCAITSPGPACRCPPLWPTGPMPARPRFVFQIKDDAYNTDSLIEFLEQFHEHFSGEKVTLIWDGLSAHRSRAMKAWIATQRSWLVDQQLPGYAHDLKPVELCGATSRRSSPNLCPDTIEEAQAAAENALERVGTSYQLCFNFLDHTGLSL